MYYTEQEPLNAVLVLDENSQHEVTSSVAELISCGVKVISSLDKLNPDDMEKRKDIIILENYILQENSISMIRLYKEIFNLNFIYLGTNDILITLMQSVARCYKVPINDLNYDKLSALINDDEATIDKIKLDYLSIEENCISLQQELLKQGLYDGTVKNLYEMFSALISILEVKDNQLKELSEYCEEQTKLLETSESQSDNLYNQMFDLMQSEYKRDLAIKQYEAIITEDVYKKISLINFRNRPFIIYFKQFTKMNDFDLFILTLYNALRVQKGFRCKVLKLYDSKDSIEIQLQPEYFKLMRSTFQNVDIEANDFLVKFGDYTKVIDLLLSNTMHIDILLIFDCKGHADRVISDADIYFEMCQSKEDRKALGLSKDLTILNDDKASPLNWRVNKAKLNKLPANLQTKELTSNIAIVSILSSIDLIMDRYDYE